MAATTHSQQYYDGLIVNVSGSRNDGLILSETPGPQLGQPYITSYKPQGTEVEPSIPATRPTQSVWKRAITWVVIVEFVVIVVLAALLGGVASGSIKTSGNTSGSSISQNPTTTVTMTSTPTSGSSTATPSSSSTSSTGTTPADSEPTTIQCPSANGRNRTITASSGITKVYRIQCNSNYSGGESNEVGLQNGSFSGMQPCLERCAETPLCVGAVYNTAQQCWLKPFIGTRTVLENVESAVLWQ
ncbi:hypothetical protein B0T19DRAFT_473590 [Cercophora scortea]|uniref:Apple domain-containing protein n=1 Tax=Cercophora scortea TaxID=314031 RepID=A0AAE0MIY4_9PEZI|nr:hypothetical protein B0T19DRAFT_473590 [Cercophora scortea]